MTGVSAVLVPYGNEGTALTRLERDLLPALAGLNAELIVVDNSQEPLLRVKAMVAAAERSGVPSLYQWNNGSNLYYGGGINIAAKLAVQPYLLYVCANHGESFDRSWSHDLLAPLLANENVAMTGSYYDSGPDHLGFPEHLAPVHIQGGVFAARTDILLANPYPNGPYAQSCSDIYMSYQLMAAGWRLVDVPSVKSVWREDQPAGNWKYVHHVGGGHD